jgi:hypothetical protein
LSIDRRGRSNAGSVRTEASGRASTRPTTGKDGDFDEYKLFLGYDSQEEAKKAYTDHIPAKFLHGMREGTIHQIKALLNQEPKESLSKAIQTMLDAG